MSKRREWAIDLLVGVVLGGLVGAIVAVNLIITVGIGYDVTLPQVFTDNFAVGIVTTAILAVGPVGGVIMMRRRRIRRSRSETIYS